VRVRTYCFPGFLRGLPGTSTRNHPHDPTTSKPVVPRGMDSYFSAVMGLRAALVGYVVPVPRCKTPRRSLGGLALVALVALVVTGCGAASSQQRASLHTSGEKRLLSLVARARVDASKHDGTAVHAVLGEFVSEVRTLNTSGQLSGTTAGKLDRAARLTAAQAQQQLHPAAVTNTATQTTTTQTTAVPTPDPGTTTVPAPATTPTSGAATGPSGPPSPAANTPAQNGQGDDQSGPPGRGHGHAYGHRYADDGSGWWGILSNWINSQNHGGGGGD
jgi:hypothetical protein